MKLSELMKDYAPKPEYEGWVTNDDYVFAINTQTGTGQVAKVADYEVVQMGIADWMLS